MKKNRKTLEVDLYKKLFLIRRSEEKIIEFYYENEMKTPMHMSMGEEAIVAGICHALQQDDQVLGTYRSHAVYLAKTMDTDNFFAEMYGKTTALLKGKGGSMHLCSPDHGFMGTSAIVASAIPLAAGAAFANKMHKKNNTVVVFFGDGATEEGVFWETLNVSCLMKLPVIFVCEDNEMAVHTHPHSRHGYRSLTEIVSKFNCHVFKEKTTDVTLIYKLFLKALDAGKAKQAPVFLHLQYYRYLEHVGVNDDFEAGYRSKDEFERWLKIDPVMLQREKLLDSGISEKEIRKIEFKIDGQIADSIMKAKKAPLAKEFEMYNGVFDEEN